MKVFTAVVTHDHGNNTYCALSEDDVNRKVMEYVREWWGDEVGDVEANPIPKDDGDAIQIYFESADSESVDFGSDDIDTTALAKAIRHEIGDSPTLSRDEMMQRIMKVLDN